MDFVRRGIMTVPLGGRAHGGERSRRGRARGAADGAGDAGRAFRIERAARRRGAYMRSSEYFPMLAELLVLADSRLAAASGSVIVSAHVYGTRSVNASGSDRAL